jgi:endogenous inhibitor of DNA gyrase (YacG/DUF329 family)
MEVFVCEECGAEKRSYPSQPRRFCSQRCRSLWFAKHTKMPTKPRRGTTVPCESCGAPLYRSQGAKDKRFCSRACLAASQRKGVERRCEGCGEAIYVVPSMGVRRFCNRACFEHHRRKRSGTGRTHNGREVIRDHSGYLRIWEPDHPAANQGRVLEHRWVIEQAIGRFLTSDEHVHHLNGVKDDNRLENLQVMDAQEHRLLTAAEMKQRRLSEAQELAEYRRRFGPLTQ